MKPKSFVATLLVFGLLAVFSAPCFADSTMARVLPQVAGMPAPGWVRPGLRLTYYSAAASLASKGTYYWRDDKGDFRGQNRDDKDKRYKRGEQSGMGGHGYTQVDVVAINQGKAVLLLSSWGLVPGGNGVVLLGSAAVVGPAGCPGDWWVHPDALKTLGNGESSDYRISRYVKEFKGRRVPVVRLEYARGGSYESYAYDESSGVLLFSSSRAISREKAHTWGGDRTALAQSDYRGARLVRIPWAAYQPPAWLARVQSLAGDGRVIVRQSGVGVFPMPLNFRMDITGRGPGWVVFQLNSTQQSPPGMPPTNSQATLVSGLAQIGGIFLPPAWLHTAQPGQVIDQDPHTKVTVSVSANTGGHVELLERGPMHQVTYRYAKQNGQLLSVVRSTRIGIAIQTTEMVVRDMR